MRSAARNDPRVVLRLGYIDKVGLQIYVRAGDLVVLAFREILHSGTALLALSFDRPVLLPDLGAMPEIRHRVGADWVRLYDRKLDGIALKEALTWARTCKRGVHAPLDALGWPSVAEKTVDAYRTILDS